MPDTKETREKKGRVKERQQLEADIEAALQAAGTAAESLPGGDEKEDLELSFED